MWDATDLENGKSWGGWARGNHEYSKGWERRAESTNAYFSAERGGGYCVDGTT